ncbi:hypothetical protein BAE42_16375 [Mesorhizobium loti]|uniref:beta strand repeat-containing protein n=1 Tax=Rhizobium loti TaxID=381 RepID=UPI0007ECF539|nr:VCBS domain-containing protein [Mesorhizobium loti]OBP72382.1 hypothetical protein BAE42_16375 [Mesorhizobium loti]
MTTSNDLDTVSHSWDEHSEHNGLPSQAQMQVAEASPAQKAAPAATEPVPVDVGNGTPVKPEAPAEAKAPAAAAPHEYVADANHVVKLPANASIDNIKVDGHNLVLEQADGSVIVIKDGALNVPTFIIGDVEVPRVALIAALEASHVDVAFGADGSISAGTGGSPSSAGGDFSVPPGGIGDGFGLSALLPPTDLAFGQPEHRELFPSLIKPNSIPSIIDLTPSVNGGDTIVNEKGLPASSGSEGSGEAQNPAPNSDQSEINTGTFTITSPDGVGSLTIAGQVISGAALANSASTPITITTPLGNTLIINGYDASSGQVSYSYTLEHSEQHPAGADNNSMFDNMTVTVTDTDGDVSAPGTLSVQIVDDVPVAHNANAGALTEDGAATTVGGNVTTDYNNTFGADGPAAASPVNWGTATAMLNGGAVNLTDYGTLTQNANGTWSFVLDNSKPATQALETGDTINVSLGYTLTDHDSDADTKTITFEINGAHDSSTVTVTPSDDANAGGASNVVYEHGLTSVADTSETDTGTFKVTATDGIKDVTIGTETHTLSDWLGKTINTGEGTLTITGVTPAGAGTEATFAYSYTLNAAQAHPAGNGNNTLPDSVAVAVDGIGGTHGDGTISIVIVDDVPVAHNADAGALTEDGAATTVGGNVTTDYNNTFGADGPAAASPVNWGTATAMLNGGAVNLTDYGTLTQNANGTWSFVLDNSKPATQALADGNTINVSLGYTLTDKDSDTDSKTITFTINGTNDTPTITGDTTGAVIEAGNADPGAVIAGTTSTDPGALTAGTPTVSGTLTAHDPDAGATATWSGNAAGTYGSFAVNATTGVWTYTLDNSKPATNALAEGASATETFTVTVTDDKGATSTQDVTVTITGANDSPVISYAAGNAAGGVTEDGTLTTGGQLASADPDTGHTAAWSISPNSPQGTGTAYGTFSVNSSGQWTYTLNNASAAVQALAQGQSVTETYTVRVTDDKGAWDDQQVTVVINGTNDTPTITGDTTGAVIEAGNADPGAVIAGTTSTDPGALTAGTPTVSGTLTAHDPDAGATATWSGNAAGTYGSFAVNATTGVWTYTLDNSKPATNALAEGASATETFTVTVTDDKGATSTQDVTVTITGANDSPVISYAAGNAAGGVTEDGTLTTGGQLASADPDTGHTAAWSISPNSPQGTGTAYGTFSVNSSGQWTYTLNNASAAVQALAQGQSVTETYTVRVTDDKGAWDDQQVTVVINGTNDVPVVTNSHNWMSSDPSQQAATGHPDGYPLLVNIPTDPDGNNLTVTAASVPVGVYYFDGAAYHVVTSGMTLFQTGGINLLDDLVYRPTATANDTVNLNLSLNVSDGLVTTTENVGIHEVAPNRLPTDSSEVSNDGHPLTSGSSQTHDLTISQTTVNGIIADPHGSTVVVYTDFQNTPITTPIPASEQNPGTFNDGSTGSHREQEVQAEIVINGNHFVVVEADTTAAKFEQSWSYDSASGMMKATVNYDNILLNGTGQSLANYLIDHPPSAGDTWTLFYTDNAGGPYQARTLQFDFFTHDPGDPGITVTGDATLPDQIYGTSGHDVLSGGGGNDIIYGAGGDDLIIGGLGKDTMTGGAGADTFKLDHLDIKDLIADYHGGEGDKIDLSALFDTAPANSISNYVHYNSATSTVSVDTSGSGNAANFVDVAVLQNAPAAGTINILYDDSNHVQHTATI